VCVPSHVTADFSFPTDLCFRCITISAVTKNSLFLNLFYLQGNINRRVKRKRERAYIFCWWEIAMTN
jgi:hypothetical protein